MPLNDRTAQAVNKARDNKTRCVITELGDRPGWKVRSATQQGEQYVVTVYGLDAKGCALLRCNCKDGIYRAGENGCHHRGAVLRRLQRSDLVRFDKELHGYVPTALGRNLFSVAQEAAQVRQVLEAASALHEATSERVKRELESLLSAI